jgi:alkylation response protein AidB-like acyl-CoA dehydrogenase
VDFELDDDQLELQRVVRDVVERECPPALVRAVVEGTDDGRGLWKTLVELDWPSLTVPAEDGGMGMSAVELAITLEELGRAADPTPFLATTSQYVPLVREAARADRRRRLLGAVCAGGTGAAAFAAEAVRARREGDAWVLAGTARHVIDGDRADELAVVAATGDGVGVFVVPAGDATATRTPAFDGSVHLAEVGFDGVQVGEDRAFVGPGLAEAVGRARDEAAGALAAVMVGASQRVLDIVVAHIRERRQFGVPIGSFQAVKHMAVDMYVAIERARALCQLAALSVARDDERRALAASLAKTAAGECQRLVARHGVQLFGGLGYTWENDLQIFVRRAKVGEPLLGSTAQHRARAARLILDHGPALAASSMRLSLDEATEAFRRDMGAWLDENAPDETSALAERARSSAHIPDWAREWQRKLFDAGWLVPGNPPEYGGRNAGLVEQFVHQEELGRRRIYPSYNPQGVSIIAPSILAFGTEEQKQRWARPILRGEITAALGMSEPDAGSDLAGLRTRAVRDGDRYIVNGQKVWTSGAHDADVILAFVRTDPDAPKHRGLSVLMVPTGSPGLTRRPFGSIVSPDDLDFNEVFFDDVPVPAENLIGELNQGWRVATGSLGHERAMLWLGFAERLDDFVTHGRDALAAHGLAADPLVLDWFGTLVADAYALRLLGYRTLAQARRGIEATEQSILKLFGSEAAQSAALHMLEALGPDALDPDERSAPIDPLHFEAFTASWWQRYLRSFSGTIAGGTSQIQRNIIAERVLGLPR